MTIEKFEDLVGQVLVSVINNDNQQIIFTTKDGNKYMLYHNQECCETVLVEDIAGDLNDIIGEPILIAEEVTSDQNPEGVKKEWQHDSFTWTFYKLSTIKGSVTIRWYGHSNGYYSEAVYFSTEEEYLRYEHASGY